MRLQISGEACKFLTFKTAFRYASDQPRRQPPLLICGAGELEDRNKFGSSSDLHTFDMIVCACSLLVFDHSPELQEHRSILCAPSESNRTSQLSRLTQQFPFPVTQASRVVTRLYCHHPRVLVDRRLFLAWDYKFRQLTRPLCFRQFAPMNILFVPPGLKFLVD
jgi:hypothetical protein